MTASARGFTDGARTDGHRPQPYARQWRRIGTFETTEAAQRAASELKADGYETTVCLIDGLSLIVR